MLKSNQEQEIYRAYITESIRAFGQRKCITVSYDELIHPRPVDNRTGEEIAADVINRIGIEVIE